MDPAGGSGENDGTEGINIIEAKLAKTLTGETDGSH